MVWKCQHCFCVVGFDVNNTRRLDFLFSYLYGVILDAQPIFSSLCNLSVHLLHVLKTLGVLDLLYTCRSHIFGISTGLKMLILADWKLIDLLVVWIICLIDLLQRVFVTWCQVHSDPCQFKWVTLYLTWTSDRSDHKAYGMSKFRTDVWNRYGAYGIMEKILVLSPF